MKDIVKIESTKNAAFSEGNYNYMYKAHFK